MCKEEFFWVQKSTLLNINFDRIVLNELHLMLRVTDVLLRNLVWACADLDLQSVSFTSTTITKDYHLNKLTEKIEMIEK